jgi:hypothetical protein
MASTRPDGYGDADLWFTEKTGNEWAAPVNLGVPVNSVAAEWGAWFTENDGAMGGTIYFGSGRSGGFGQWDIWRAQAAPAAVGELPHPQRIELAAFPNPGTSMTTIAFGLAEAARVVVGIYDLEGRLVRSLLDQHRLPGDCNMLWDTTLDSGDEAPSGTYYCKVQGGSSCACQRVVIAR